jgi:hypothetical protein
VLESQACATMPGLSFPFQLPVVLKNLSLMHDSFPNDDSFGFLLIMRIKQAYSKQNKQLKQYGSHLTF